MPRQLVGERLIWGFGYWTGTHPSPPQWGSMTAGRHSHWSRNQGGHTLHHKQEAERSKSNSASSKTSPPPPATSGIFPPSRLYLPSLLNLITDWGPIIQMLEAVRIISFKPSRSCRHCRCRLNDISSPLFPWIPVLVCLLYLTPLPNHVPTWHL